MCVFVPDGGTVCPFSVRFLTPALVRGDSVNGEVGVPGRSYNAECEINCNIGFLLKLLFDLKRKWSIFAEINSPRGCL